jgi:triacylglycerol lipase
MMATAATDLAGISSNLTAARSTATPLTTGLIPAAYDEVSAAIAEVFSAHGQGFHALGAQFTATAEQFMQTLKSSASAYTSAESQAASGLLNQYFTDLLSIISSPPISPFPAPLNPTFTGAPSLLTKIEGELLFTPLKAFFNLPAVDHQLVTPGSPLLTLFADAPNIPGLNLLISNSPPKLLTSLLGETVTQTYAVNLSDGFTTYHELPVIQIALAHPDGNYVVAIHGGAGILPPLLFHWIDYTMLAYQTGATIEVPIYPLVSQGGTAPVVIPQTAGFIESLITAHGAPHVSVLGDSAGGNIALASTEFLITHNEAVPASLVLLSPVVDASLTNPAIGSITGSWLPPTSVLQQIDKQWAAGLPLNNYEVSPLYGPLKGLPPTYIYAGSQDIAAPDLAILQQQAVAQGAPISFALATGETHDWITVTPDGLQYWPQIRQELGA